MKPIIINNNNIIIPDIKDNEIYIIEPNIIDL